MTAASISPCASNGGEPGREKAWREGKVTMDEERSCNNHEDGAVQGIVVGQKKPLGESTPRAKLPGDERGAKTSSVSRCVGNGGGTRRRAWGEGKLTEEEEHEESRRNEMEESAARRGNGVGEGELRDDRLSALTAKPADDWNSMSDSLPPAGKLNGWANTQDDEDWLEDFDKTPTSEPGSHKTCSTQWSELSGGSGNSYAVDESSAMSGELAPVFCHSIDCGVGWLVSF